MTDATERSTNSLPLAADAARPLIVTDFLEAKPGLEEQLAAELEVVVTAERASALAHGAELFELHRDGAGSGRFLILERWSSRAAFDAFHARHRPAELTAFLPRADALLARPLADSVTFWTTQIV